MKNINLFKKYNSLAGFTPLEKAADFIRRLSSRLVRKERSSLTGFTLLEIVVVIIIIGLLTTLAVPSFKEALEEAQIKYAQTVLKSIRGAEKLYKARVGSYIGVDIDANADDKSDDWDLLGIEVEDDDEWKFGVEVIAANGGCNAAGAYGSNANNLSCVPFARRLKGDETGEVMHIQISNGAIIGTATNPAPGQLRASLSAGVLICAQQR